MARRQGPVNEMKCNVHAPLLNEQHHPLNERRESRDSRGDRSPFSSRCMHIPVPLMKMKEKKLIIDSSETRQQDLHRRHAAAATTNSWILHQQYKSSTCINMTS
jgi:hypothetical protein